MANTLSKINNCNSIITQNQSKKLEHISFKQDALRVIDPYVNGLELRTVLILKFGSLERLVLL